MVYYSYHVYAKTVHDIVVLIKLCAYLLNIPIIQCKTSTYNNKLKMIEQSYYNNNIIMIHAGRGIDIIILLYTRENNINTAFF